MMSILGKIFVSLKSDDEAGVIVKAAARIARTAAITRRPEFKSLTHQDNLFTY